VGGAEFHQTNDLDNFHNNIDRLPHTNSSMGLCIVQIVVNLLKPPCLFQSAISTLESSRESLTEELTSLMNTNEDLSKENKQLQHVGKSYQVTKEQLADLCIL
jgi:FtsZ-binding cell division protein ZapB